MSSELSSIRNSSDTLSDTIDEAEAGDGDQKTNRDCNIRLALKRFKTPIELLDNLFNFTLRLMKTRCDSGNLYCETFEKESWDEIGLKTALAWFGHQVKVEGWMNFQTFT